MMRKSWLLGAAVAATLCVWTATSRADDTIRLDIKGKNAAQTTNLLGDGGADTVQARWWRGYYRPYYYPRYYYPRYYGYYPRVGVSVAIGRPYYYAPAYYYPPPVYYPAPGYVAPIGLNLSVPFVSLSIARRPAAVAAPVESGSESIPAPRPAKPAQPDGTFQYDGGPANPVPMPQAEPSPNRAAPATVVPEGRVVSLKTKAPKYGYAAYGEKPATGPADDRQLAAKPAK